MVNCYAWYTESERRGTSPHPPFKGGEERGEALGEQANALGVRPFGLGR